MILFDTILQRCAPWTKITVHAVILPSNGSSTWNTEAVLDSGGADAMAMTIDSLRKTIARPTALNRKGSVCLLYDPVSIDSIAECLLNLLRQVLALCLEYLVLVKVITLRGITTL